MSIEKAKEICRQAHSELADALNYFREKGDGNGAYIAVTEITDLEEIYRCLDQLAAQRDRVIGVPNVYEFGFYYQDVCRGASAEVIAAVSARNDQGRTSLRMKNGCFYGYYCYNIYNKCAGWLQGVTAVTPEDQEGVRVVREHFLKKLSYFLRYE